MTFRPVVAAAFLFSLLSVPGAVAAASPTLPASNPAQPAGAIPHVGSTPPAAAPVGGALGNPSCTGCSPPLTYGGGFVAGGVSSTPGHVTITPVFWGSFNAFPGIYEALISRFISDVAAASGTNSNVFSVATQYFQNVGQGNQFIQYSFSAGLPIFDTDPYPGPGCTADAGYSACVTNAQLQAELTSNPQINPRSDTHIYVALFPPGVETCNSNSNAGHGGACSGNAFCANHSYAGAPNSNLLFYEDVPYPVATCNDGILFGGVNQSPNSNLPADNAINFISHETNETVTDGLFYTGWADANFFEQADECAFVFGQPLGGVTSQGTDYNQVINGDHYLLQDEFSNAAFALGQGDLVSPNYPSFVPGCVQRLASAPLAVSTQGPLPAATAGTPYNVSLSATGGAPPYTWSLAPGSGPLPTGLSLLPNGAVSGTPSVAGTSSFTVRVSDSTGATATMTLSLTVGLPAQTITFTSTPPANPTVGGSPYTVTATASSGLPVTFTIDGSSTSGACSIVVATVSFTGTGSCVIDANQGGNASFAPAAQVQQHLTVAAAALTAPPLLSSTSLSFGSVAVGSTSTAQSVSVTNVDTTHALIFTTVAVSGPFALAATSSCVGATLSYLQTCSVSVDFQPSATGPAAGNVTISDNAGNSPQTVSLSGTGTPPIVTLLPQTITFTSTPPANPTVGNSYAVGAMATSGLPVTITIDASSTPGACRLAGSTVIFQAPGSCVIDANQAGNATFAPAAQVQQDLTLSAATLTAAPFFSTSTITFGVVKAGSQSQAQTVTVTNFDSTHLLTVSVVQASAPFVVLPSSCTGASLGFLQSCTVVVSFAPTTTGPATGSLTINDNAVNTPQTVTLSGQGA